MKNIKETISKMNESEKQQLREQAEKKPNNIISSYVLKILRGE